MKQQTVNITDETYPLLLKKINNPPQKLYAKGNIELLNSNSIAVVGSRKCSEYGLKLAEKFAFELAKKEITIVSGMALGIDTAAHIGAIKAKGKTIAVLGGGFNHIFPTENEELFSSIINSGGLVITEHKPEEEAKGENFPIRNRIISGISLGALVVESGYRSGANLTAGIAAKQGKKVFAIPYTINGKYIGTNELIKNGANLVSNTNEILKQYNIKTIRNSRECKNGNVGSDPCVAPPCVAPSARPIDKTKENPHINPEYKKIYETLTEEPQHINIICRKLNDNIANISSILTMLELEGKIEQLPGKMFRKKDMYF